MANIKYIIYIINIIIMLFTRQQQQGLDGDINKGIFSHTVHVL